MHTSATERKPIFEKLEKKRFSPAHVAEVGVYLPETCNVLDYATAGIRTTLVEANPRIVKKIESFFAGKTNVTIHPLAVFDKPGELELFDRDASTFVGAIGTSPAVVNDAYKTDESDGFIVEAVTFDSIDDGTIDLISVDIEGCEWYVIKHMRSRPAVISLETHGAKYVNPYVNEIHAWMTENNYIPFYKDKTDTVFVKRGTITITARDKCALYINDLRFGFRRLRKNLFS